MKKLVLIFVIGLIGFSVNAQKKVQVLNASKKMEAKLDALDHPQNTDPNAPVFKFKKEVVEYGEIERNSNGLRVLKFTNVGKTPLIIKSVIGSCGCTVPTSPKEPIMPGASAEIQIKYATNRMGAFSKTVTISSNAKRSKIIIPVTGRVKKESALSLLEKKKKSEVQNN